MADTTTYMLTTVDNPYDPFTQFEEWYQWDVTAGYHTSSYLARMAKLSDETSDADQEDAIRIAIDQIVKENVSGMWRKVKESGEVVA